MDIVILICFFILIFYAFYELLGFFIVTPSARAENLIMSYGKTYMSTKWSEKVNWKIASYILPHIKLSEKRIHQIRSSLHYLKIQQTPEEYIAFTIVDMIVLLFFGILAKFVFGNIAIIVGAVGAVFIGKGAFDKLDEAAKKKGEAIAGQLPMFASAFVQEMYGTKEVKRFIRDYMNSAKCSNDFKYDLQVAYGAMNIKNERYGLELLMSNIDSPDLNEIVRNMISVTEGSSDIEKFVQLADSLFEKQKTTILKSIDGIESKLTMCSFILVGAVLFFFIAIMIMLALSKSSILG